jgi:hypothetical protein
MKDPAVRCLSPAARGVWFDMLMAMAESPIRGYLCRPDGSAIPPEQIARIVGVSREEIAPLLTEMAGAGTYSVVKHATNQPAQGKPQTEPQNSHVGVMDGVIFSRRLVRDHQLSDTRREVGKLGGEHGHKGGRPKKSPPLPPDSLNHQNRNPKNPKPNGKPQANSSDLGLQGKGQNNPPSSSSSSSTSVDNPHTPEGAAGDDLSGTGDDNDGLVGFSLFWANYPPRRKTAKGKCEAKWKAMKCSRQAEQINAALMAQRASPDWTKEDGQYVPAPHRWLNERRWETELDPATKPADKTSALNIDPDQRLRFAQMHFGKERHQLAPYEVPLYEQYKAAHPLPPTAGAR